MTGITVQRSGARTVAVKQATDPARQARLRHEADVLARIEHPGVVRFVDFTTGPPARLRTAYVGPDSWATCEPPFEALAAVTATVADLHDAGFTHGRLQPTHVLIDDRGTPVLCGFADAGPATPERVQADRDALAALVRDRADRGRGTERSRLADAADALGEPALPLRAAIRLLDAAPEFERKTDRRFGRPHARLATITAGLLLAVAVLAGALAGFGPSRSNPGPPAPAGPVGTIVDPPTTAAPGPTAGDEPATIESPTAAAPTLGPASGVILDHDGRRYGVGAPGDEVVVADWACTGEATPAVLRPRHRSRRRVHDVAPTRPGDRAGRDHRRRRRHRVRRLRPPLPRDPGPHPGRLPTDRPPATVNPTRPVLALLAAVAAAGALFAVPSPAIDLVADADVLTWWERHGTAAAVIGVVHVAALAATTYVVAVLTLVASAALVRCPAAALRLARFGPTPVRRWLVAGLVAGSLAAPAGAHAPARDVSTSPAAETRIVLVDLGPAPPTTEAPSTRERVSMEHGGADTRRVAGRSRRQPVDDRGGNPRRPNGRGAGRRPDRGLLARPDRRQHGPHRRSRPHSSRAGGPPATDDQGR